jgi:hypothetical protein
MIKSIAATALLSLFFISSPAHAAYTYLEDLNLDYGNGYTAVGPLEVNVFKFTTVLEFPTISFDGNPLPPPFLGLPINAGYPLLIPGGEDLNIADYELYGVRPVSGTVTFEGYSNTVPLPSALPLFGSGLLVLASFAVYRMKHKFS